MAENNPPPDLSKLLPTAGLLAQPLPKWLLEGEILSSIAEIIPTPKKSSLANCSSHICYSGQATYAQNKELKEHDTCPHLNPKNYAFPTKAAIPLAIQALLLFFFYEEYVPPDVPCHIRLGKYGRKGKMKISPPDEKELDNKIPKKEEVIKRAIVHIGPDEVYKLTEIINNNMGDSKDIVMFKNSFLWLEGSDVSQNNIYVSPNTKVEFPSVVPTNYGQIAKEKMAKMGLSASDKAINSDRVRNALNKDNRLHRTTIRSNSYQRTTIIIDFGPSLLILPPKKNSNIIPDKMPDHIPKIKDYSDLPPHIAASLPKGISPKLINRFANNEKLSKTVLNMAGTITDSLKDKGLFQGDKTKINPEMLKEVSRSAAENIDIDALKNLKPELDEAMKGIMPSGMNGKVRRKARRRQKRKQKKQQDKEQTTTTTTSPTENISDIVQNMVQDSNNDMEHVLQNVIQSVQEVAKDMQHE